MIVDIARRRVCIEPLPDVSFGRVRSFCERGRSGRLAIPHRAVQAEAVPDQDQRGLKYGTEVRHNLAQQRVQFLFVDIHNVSSLPLLSSSLYTVSLGRVGPASMRLG